MLRKEVVEENFAHVLEQVEHYPWNEEQKGFVYEVMIKALILGKVLGREQALAEDSPRFAFAAPQAREGTTE